MSYYTRTKYDPEFEKQAAVATRLVNLYEETLKDLLNIARGCRKLFHEMGDSHDERGTKAQLLEIIERLDRALEALKR